MGRDGGRTNGIKDCVVVGRANVGKSLFLINFAAYLGLSLLELELEGAGGSLGRWSGSLEGALGELVDSTPHRTRGLQSLTLSVPRGKTRQMFRLRDTSGFDDGIHPDPSVRAGMVLSIQALRGASLVLHMLDAAAIGESKGGTALNELDHQVARYASSRGAYAVLANKIDLPWARTGLLHIVEEFASYRVIPISALERRGFREVKAFVWRNL